MPKFVNLLGGNNSLGSLLKTHKMHLEGERVVQTSHRKHSFPRVRWRANEMIQQEGKNQATQIFKKSRITHTHLLGSAFILLSEDIFFLPGKS